MLRYKPSADGVQILHQESLSVEQPLLTKQGTSSWMKWFAKRYLFCRSAIVRGTGETLTSLRRDLNTRFSGIIKDDLAKAVMELPAVRAAVCMFIGPETIIVGHG
jgi:hypothetical protein